MTLRMLHVASMGGRFFDQLSATLLIDSTRTCEIRDNWTKLRVILALCMALPMLGGCPGSTNDAVESTATAPQPTGSGNSAPTISGPPPSTTKISEPYSFTPSASDPDGDNLTFSILNKPRWTAFDAATGNLSGIPNLGDEGTYANIDISVSDGSLSASLPTFSVDVSQVALGSVTLSWTPPTQNEDGSVLTDLAAYKFYYGTAPGNYSNSIRVDNPGIASFVIDNLSPNTYFFVATAINDSGVESRFSNEATKQVL